MEKLIVKGPTALRGRVRASGAKNAAVAILPAVILTGGKVRLENIPDITDVRGLLAILENLGVSIRRRGRNRLELNPAHLRSYIPPYDMVKKMRASYYLMGSLLARFGKAEIPLPGGCDLGPRPIDQHLKGFAALGVNIEGEHGLVKMSAKKMRGANIYFDVVSVGATINLMIAAAAADGRTVLENTAKEPEIVDVANFLNAMGASIRGAGTDVIRIDGVKEFHGAEHTIIPDRIEAGTYMFAAAVTKGDVVVEEVIPKHLEAVIAKLREAGVEVDVGPDRLRVRRSGPLHPVDLKTFPYPGFPTDLQPMGMTLLAAAEGTSIVTENVFEGRFRHVDELKRMGARIKVEGRTAVIEGGAPLTGAPVQVSDLRAGAALLLGAMAAEGETTLLGVDMIYRGYEDLEGKLNSLGAMMKKVRSGLFGATREGV